MHQLLCDYRLQATAYIQGYATFQGMQLFRLSLRSEELMIVKTMCAVYMYYMTLSFP